VQPAAPGRLHAAFGARIRLRQDDYLARLRKIERQIRAAYSA